MDFFAAQARARQQSRLLTVAFVLCVSAVVLALDVVALAVLRLFSPVDSRFHHPGLALSQWASLHPGATVLVTLLAAGFILGASLYRMLQLRQGGGYVARSVGGVRVERFTPDPLRRRLHNVVEEMALASGVPAPEIYVLEDEAGINAFAAGHSVADAAIAVTHGALVRLDRRQLQGVIAHEFSHILNGDMRLSMRLIGLTFGLMAVSLAGRTLLRLARHGERAAIPALVLGATVATVGQLGWWGGRVLQAWISRKRESLADASAVQFTRDAQGLQEALIRVAAMGENRRVRSPHLQQVAHMLFAHGGRSLLATHPSLLARLRALDPYLNRAALEARKRQVQKQWAKNAGPPAAAPSREAPAGIPVAAAAALIAASAGDPQAHHLRHAIALRRALPPALRSNASDPQRSCGQLLAMVLSDEPLLARRQLEAIKETLGPPVHKATLATLSAARRLPPLLRLPGVLQLLPSLGALPAQTRAQLCTLLRRLMRMDGKTSVMEYALEALVARVLEMRQKPRPPHGTATLAAVEAPLGILFAVLARHGNADAGKARRAYEAGIGPLLPRERPAYAIIDDWPRLLDDALQRLGTLAPAAKQMLVEGLVRTIAHDGLLAPAEAELLRTVCAVLEVPLPPVLPDPQAVARA